MSVSNEIELQKPKKKNIYIHKPIVHFIFKSEIQSRMNYQTHTFRLLEFLIIREMF